MNIGLFFRSLGLSLGLWVGVAGLVMAQVLPPEQVGEAIAQEFDVDVLSVDPITLPDGRDGYAVKVMNRGGTSNAAFQVNTLAVDAETGDLVPVYRHTPTGQVPAGALTKEPNRHGPDAHRGSTWR